MRWGEQTNDEMLVGCVEVAPVDQDLSPSEPLTRKLGDGRYEVTFRYQPPANARAVYLAGTFNDWKPTALKMDGPDGSGMFQAKVVVNQGPLEYKFLGTTMESSRSASSKPSLYIASLGLERRSF